MEPGRRVSFALRWRREDHSRRVPSANRYASRVTNGPNRPPSSTSHPSGTSTGARLVVVLTAGSLTGTPLPGDRVPRHRDALDQAGSPNMPRVGLDVCRDLPHPVGEALVAEQ